jgi:intein/homing endonuclease
MSLDLSQEIREFLKNEYPNVDIENMSIEELKTLKEEITNKRQELLLLEMAQKTLGNAAYGASASPWFYFFNVDLAADITGECRHLTKYMWDRFEKWFHEDIWERKDLWEKFNFALDESKHDWYRQQHVSVYSDTDSSKSDSLLLIKDNKNIESKITIEDFFNKHFEKNGLADITTNNQEIVKCSDDTVLNWTDDKKLYYAPVKYIMRHKVTKSKFRIKSKSGKEVIVTGDHSCIVFRDGKQMEIKAKDINPKTDKILVIHENEN